MTFHPLLSIIYNNKLRLLFILVIVLQIKVSSSYAALTIKMVEGHSVSRLASRFRTTLVGRTFSASSPNGRFADGASVIDGRVLSRMEAIGKNLFAFFSNDNGTNNDGTEDDAIVVHVHFGMSGAWALFSGLDEEPEVKATTRLRLEEVTSNSSVRYATHLSAMTLQHGDMSLYANKKASLGQDPLRSDADVDLLYNLVKKSKRSIAQIIMDQSYFSGPGNIYRAEILFLAGVYPTTLGTAIDRATFNRIWNVTVKLLRRGYDTGSILTVDASIDPEVAQRGERRYIYNKSNCARCGGRVSSWNISGRTCYACEGGCQVEIATAAMNKMESAAIVKKEKKDVSVKKQHVPFVSHCAPMALQQRLEQGGAEQLTISEIRSVLEQMVDNSSVGGVSLPPKSARKLVHVNALNKLLNQKQKVIIPKKEKVVASKPLPPPSISAEEAAREKFSR